MFSKLSLVAFLLCSILNLHAAHAQLPFPDFQSDVHQYEIMTNGSVHTDLAVNEQLKKLPELAYLIKIRPKVRGEDDARWWMDRLLGKWKSQGFRSDWHLAVVCEDPPLLILHSPKQKPGNVMNLLEGITSHQDYWKVVKERDTAKSERDTANTAKENVTRTNSSLQKQLEQKDIDVEKLKKELFLTKVTFGMAILLLLVTVAVAVRICFKGKRQVLEFFMTMLSQKMASLNLMMDQLKLGGIPESTKNLTQGRIRQLLAEVARVKASISFSSSWLHTFLDLLTDVKTVEEKVNEVRSVDIEAIRRTAYPPLLARDMFFHEQAKKAKQDPYDFDVDGWRMMETDYAHIAHAVSVLGLRQVEELLKDLERSPLHRRRHNPEPTRSEAAEFLAAQVLLRKHL